MSPMAQTMRIAALTATLLTLLFALLGIEPLAISCGVTAYHLLMRLLVGSLLDRLPRLDPNHPWFRPRAFEPRLYQCLRIASWKASMPTYDPSLFDRHLHTWPEIIQAMCQAELVHEAIVLLSFLPLAVIPIFGAPWAFILTSIAAAAIDTLFVLMQRYNRPRVMLILQRLAERNT